MSGTSDKEFINIFMTTFSVSSDEEFIKKKKIDTIFSLSGTGDLDLRLYKNIAWHSFSASHGTLAVHVVCPFQFYF